MLCFGQLSLTIACFIIYRSGTGNGRRITQCGNKNLPTSCQALGNLSLALVGGLKQDPGRPAFYPPSFPLPHVAPKRVRAYKKNSYNNWEFREHVRAGGIRPSVTPPAPEAAAARLRPCQPGSSARLSAGHGRSTG